MPEKFFPDKPNPFHSVAELESAFKKLGEDGIDIDLGEILPEALGYVNVAVTPRNYKGWIIRLRIAFFLFWLGSKVAGFRFEEEEADEE